MGKWDQKVKARAHESEDEGDDFDVDGGSSPSVLETGDVGDIMSSGDEDDDLDASEKEDDEEQKTDAQEQLKKISFGTLAKAQDSMSKKRKRGSDTTPQQEDKLEALRARLRELKQAKGLATTSDEKAKPNKESKRKTSKVTEGAEDSEDDSEGSDSDDDQPRARTSKHAPMSQSTKYQVSRRRDVVDVPKRKVRDPRFGAMAGQVDPTRIDKNYSFLHDYEATEMNELKAAIKKSKSEEDTQKLKRTLMSMENKKRARLEKEREQNVIREHRKKEKEAVAQGKKPYYLKEAEIKKQALVNKFESMKGKEREKAIEKRRRKESQREKKAMPQVRRTVG
ncbi:hypothetical protein MBLNU457_7138t1 [Dothideomycetes sp. NU457]